MLSGLHDISVHFAHVRVIRIELSEMVADQFSAAAMLHGAELLADARVDAICWKGTSATSRDRHRNRAMCRTIEGATSVPQTSSVLVMLDLLCVAGLNRIGLVTLYTGDVQRQIANTLSAAGFTIVHETHFGLSDNYASATVPDAEIEAMIRRAATAAPQILLVMCTNLCAPPLAGRLKAKFGIPFSTPWQQPFGARCGSPASTQLAWRAGVSSSGASASERPSPITDQRRVSMTTWNSLNVGVLALLASIFLGLGTAASAADTDAFASQLAPYMKKPSFTAPGPAFDARACAKGKTVFSIPQSSANPFTANIERTMQAAAAKIGLGFVVWQNQGNHTEYVQGMNTALNQKATLIDLLAGPDPRALVPQVKAAADAGIPTVASHFNGYEQSAEVAKYAAGDVPIDYVRAGALMVDWAIVHTDGKLNALVVTAPGPLSSDSTLSGIKAELAKCASCTSRTLEFPDSWASKITPAEPGLSHQRVF